MRLKTTLILLSACLAAATAGAATTLKPYRDDAEFGAAVQRWRQEAQRLQADHRRASAPWATGAMTMFNAAPAAPAAKMAAESAAAPAIADSITNVQTAGVDEGGIVKRVGEHLVVLRRGRLFTVRVGGGDLAPVAMVNAYPSGADPQGTWYDELLVEGRTVVVVGYSYQRGGTEIGLFEMGDGGMLTYRATYHLRSHDYYSSRNYASRLVEHKLVLYTPSMLPAADVPFAGLMPAARRWQPGLPADFERLLPATRIYRTDDDFDPREPLALHTVTSCDLGEAPMRCDSTAVLGPAGRVFYVSQGSVYVWTTTLRRWRGGAPADRPDAAGTASAVFRLPLDGSAPSGLKTAGVPLDQMSFLEDGQQHLNVLVRAAGAGEGMFEAEASRGALALLRVPLAAFGDGRGVAGRERYQRVPGPAGQVQNRYIGDWLVWGGGDGAWALRPADGGTPAALQPGHAVERIEALGSQALLVGNAGSDLVFSGVRLSGREARLQGRHVQEGARQGETRTHGFFYRPTGTDEGLLGLPIVGSNTRTRAGLGATAGASASVVFLRERGLSLTALGELAARPGVPRDDACKASCVDWYGNARPIFIGDRVLALMGYEVVEGRVERGWRGERVDEVRRISIAPAPGGRPARPTPFD